MANLVCRMDGWRCKIGHDGPFGADVSIDVWIEGGTIGGRIAGRVVEDSNGAPFVLEEHRDDFALECETRQALLVEVYRTVGLMPDFAEGSSVAPTPLDRWLCDSWEDGRVRALVMRMESTIRERYVNCTGGGVTFFFH